MARDTDRKIISEAVRTQKLWRIMDNSGGSVLLHTDYQESLYIRYGGADQVVRAIYRHWDGDVGQARTVSKEDITRNKRKRVLELINQKDVG